MAQESGGSTALSNGGPAVEPALVQPAVRLTALQKVLYGVGGLSSGIKGRALGVYVIPFYTIIIGVDPRWAGIAIGVSRIWDMISDPLIGHFSDSIRHPEGRRRIFLRRVAIPYAIVAWAFWATPRFGQHWQLVAYLACAYIALYTVSTLFTVPYYALGAELSEHYDERTSIAGYRQMFVEFGAMLGVLLPAFLIYGGESDLAVWGLDRRYVWKWMGGIFGVLMFLAAYVPYRATREPGIRSPHQPSMWKSVQAALGNGPFLVLAAAHFVMNFGWALVGGLVLIVVTYVLHQQAHFKYFMLTQIGVGLVSVPLWMKLSVATSKITAYRITQILQALIFLGAYWITPEALWATYLLFIVAGAAMAGGSLTSTALIADISDLDELQTGHRREGMFYAALWFLTKLPGALGAATVGLILAYVHFSRDLEVQSAWTVEGLRFFFGLVVALTQALGAYFLAFFPLTRERHGEVRAQLDAKRAAETAEAPA